MIKTKVMIAMVMVMKKVKGSDWTNKPGFSLQWSC
jgi:hypothetical protein